MSQPSPLGKRILSIDGGGFRGLGSLLVIEAITNAAHGLCRDPESPPLRPCEIFDIMFGSSTGGLLAVLLGRLGLDCKTAIQEYKMLAQKLFGDDRNAFLDVVTSDSVLDSQAYEDALADVVSRHGGNKDLPFLDGTPGNKTQTAVITQLKDVSHSQIALSWTASVHQWLTRDIARQTTAADIYVSPLQIEEHGKVEVYVDAAYSGFINPSLLGEQQLWDRSERDVLVSIGQWFSAIAVKGMKHTRSPADRDAKPFVSELLSNYQGTLGTDAVALSIVKKLLQQAARTVDVNTKLSKTRGYYRVDPPLGIGKWELVDHFCPDLEANVKSWLASPEGTKLVNEIATKLVIPLHQKYVEPPAEPVRPVPPAPIEPRPTFTEPKPVELPTPVDTPEPLEQPPLEVSGSSEQVQLGVTIIGQSDVPQPVKRPIPVEQPQPVGTPEPVEPPPSADVSGSSEQVQLGVTIVGVGQSGVEVPQFVERPIPVEQPQPVDTPKPVEQLPLADPSEQVQLGVTIVGQPDVEVPQPVERPIPVEQPQPVETPKPVEQPPSVDVSGFGEQVQLGATIVGQPDVEVPQPVERPIPVEQPQPVETPKPVEQPPLADPSEQVQLEGTIVGQPDVEVPQPIRRPTPAERPTSVKQPTPVERPQPVEAPKPVKQPEPVEIPKPIERPTPVEPPQPVKSPAREPNGAPPPTARPTFVEAPRPVVQPQFIERPIFVEQWQHVRGPEFVERPIYYVGRPMFVEVAPRPVEQVNFVDRPTYVGRPSFVEASKSPNSTEATSLPVSEGTYKLNSTFERPVPTTMIEHLRNYHVILLIDDSSSMVMEAGRWEEAREALRPIADYALQYKADTLDMRFVNSPRVCTAVKESNFIMKVFDSERPPNPYANGWTKLNWNPTGHCLQRILNDALDQLDCAIINPTAYQQIKQFNIILLTGGDPSDDPMVKSALENAWSRIKVGGHDPNCIGIQIVQIGNDPKATTKLQDLVNGNIGNIVDTVPYNGVVTPEKLPRILLGALQPNIRAIYS